MTAFYEGGQGAVIMTNSDSGGQIASELMLAIAKEYGWSSPVHIFKTAAELPDEVWSAIEGSYRGPMGELAVEAKEGRLIVTVSAPEVPEGLVFEFVPESKTSLFSPQTGMQATVVWIDDATVGGLELADYEFEKE